MKPIFGVVFHRGRSWNVAERRVQGYTQSDLEPSGLERFVSVPGGHQRFSISSLTRSSRGKSTCPSSLVETYHGSHRGISYTGYLLSQSAPS